jgi:hypothetical protein
MLLGALFVAIAASPVVVLADEPSLLGRLFRFGGGSTGSSSGGSAASSNLASEQPDELRSIQAPAPSSTRNSGTLPRLVPQPRVSRPLTESDPLVTRIILGRADQGTQFGMFLQVFADGTVIDSEGPHQVGREGIKEVLDVLEKGEIFRVKGHCGGPPTDFIEQVYLTVFERSLGRLRASAFSCSGNTQGCDHSVRHLQTALDTLQSRLARPVSPAASPGGAAASTNLLLEKGTVARGDP